MQNVLIQPTFTHLLSAALRRAAFTLQPQGVRALNAFKRGLAQRLPYLTVVRRTVVEGGQLFLSVLASQQPPRKGLVRWLAGAVERAAPGFLSECIGKQIADIEDKMARAQVIDVSKLSGTQVKFGATVSVIDEDTEEEAAYQIVGEHEADVKSGKISISSSIARAMIGKETGDVVEVNTPGGVKAYEIAKVEWI